MHPTSRLIFFLLSLILFALVIWKAAAIPVTHDEVATAVHYLHFNAWEIMMYPDPWPNNHILNTLLTKAVVSVMGICSFCIRIPSMLSFPVYVYAVYRLLKLYPGRSISWTVGIGALFLLNPYLLDFYSLCRGYGMAVAFCTLSVSFLVSAFFKNRDKDLVWAVLFAMFAAYANFTLLVYWAAVQLCVCLYLVNEHRHDFRRLVRPALAYLVMALAFLALIYTPIRKMTETEQFVYWSSAGFYKETIKSLLNTWSYHQAWYKEWPADLLPATLLIIVFLTLSAALWLRFNYLKSKQLLAVGLLFLTALVSIAQTLILETPNLHGRTALLFYPLFMHVLLSFSVWFNFYKWKMVQPVLGGTLFIMALLNFIPAFNLQATLEWWYDANTTDVIEYIRENDERDTVVLNTHWMFQPSFSFYEFINESAPVTVLDKQPEIDTTARADYYYVFDSELTLLEKDYRKLKEFGWGKWLLIRESN